MVEGSSSSTEQKYPDFARRMAQATDALPEIPPLHNGRLRWFVDKLRSKGVSSTSETVRRWFGGFSMPRQGVLVTLAEILRVDAGWLSVGTPVKAGSKERNEFEVGSSGAVNLIAGFIQLDGGTCAFPGDDELSRHKGIDLHAIIKGVKYDLHIATGFKKKDAVTFRIPFAVSDIIVLGVVRDETFSIRVFELPWSDVATRGKPENGHYVVNLDESVDRPILNFTDRL